MKLYCHLIGTKILQALGKYNFLLIDFNAMLFLAGSCDLLGRYRAKGLAAFSCFDLNHDLLSLQLRCQSFCRIQVLLCYFFFIRFLKLQVIHIFGSCFHTDLFR